MSGAKLRGTVCAAVTPLTDGGRAVDLDAVPGLVDFYVESGLQGLLAFGTTGEGVLLGTDERIAGLRAFVEAGRGKLAVAAHCGAQTTAETVRLVETAVASSADAVAVISPPYFALDEAELYAHLLAAGRAAGSVPFYVYEFAARSGYAVPIAVIERLHEALPNLAGLKISDAPFDRLEPYLLPGLDGMVGPEALIGQGLRCGAVGAVSGLAAALPAEVRNAVESGSDDASEEAGALRAQINRFPFQAVLKEILRWRGVQVGGAVRLPLRGLSANERADLVAEARDASTPLGRACARGGFEPIDS